MVTMSGEKEFYPSLRSAVDLPAWNADIPSRKTIVFRIFPSLSTINVSLLYLHYLSDKEFRPDSR